MVNQEELAICRRRGRHAIFLGSGWVQCKWCGMWLRGLTTIEEREDEPPEEELALGVRTDRGIAALQDKLGIQKRDSNERQ